MSQFGKWAGCALMLWGAHGFAAPMSAEPVSSEWGHKLSVQGGYAPRDGVLGASSDDFYSLRYEPSFNWYSPDKQWHKWQVFARGWLAYDENAALVQEQDDARTDGFNAELREFFVRRRLLGDDPRFALTLGRQRYSDRLGLWWDDALESVRFDYQGSTSEGFLALGQKLASYNTDIDHLSDADDEVLYAFGEYALRWSSRHWLGGRAMLEHDHSDKDIEDRRDYQGYRLGLFAKGDAPLGSLLLDYHSEFAFIDGEREQYLQRQWQSVDVQGWAWLSDVGLQWSQLILKPRLSLQWGLTDKPTAADDGFFQNRIQSDRVRENDDFGTRLVSSFFRLEVRNLKYVGLGLRIEPASRQELNLRLTDLHRQTDLLPGALRTEQEMGSGTHLGQMLDLQWYWEQFPRAFNGRVQQLNLLVGAGAFFPADAMGDMDTQYQLMLGLTARY
ncbi:hypothetical protein KJI95_11250 [Shewanella sp. JM162201]|uniref:Alginate export domain-containing protein n=1 Tax=Shewanella jiangmenensis TaxID=2837387 RepID=A0ABS5V644_9GAMM|nr:alginate export family protein [Shewanella jiangmenensis]MBT1445096.1 hypothetical protein [Shewanella jiangmenensis]